MPRWIAFVLVFAVVGCATYREDLNRGQRLFDDNQYERSLAVWRMLEPDYGALDGGDRVRYCYFRGMTDFRMGYKPDARHWLALARALENSAPGSLEVDSVKRMDEALAELNAEVWGVEEDSSNPLAQNAAADQ